MKRDIQPSTNLALSMRDMGYTFDTALADIVDNSIAARSRKISIICPPHYPPHIAIIDDGEGLDENEIVDALILATKPPASQRGKTDLGRFGMGMKTASWSQCRRLTLASKKHGRIVAASIDLDDIEAEGKWIAYEYEAEELQQVPLINRLQEQPDGTLLLWEKLDRADLGLARTPALS